MNRNRPISALVIFIPAIIGSVSGYLTRNATKNFDQLNKPPFTPPGSVFPVVWIALYILMGIALFLAINEHKETSTVIAVFSIQMVLNFGWSLIFFGYGAILTGLLWIILYCLSVLWNVMTFMRINRLSGWLMMPTLVWGLFATYLNLGFFLLNGSMRML